MDINPEPVLRIRSVSKSFGGNRVLESVTLDLHGGEVHVLAGENGAGKSTLIKILGGIYSDYEGEFELDGAIARFASPQSASQGGVAVIHQELSLVPSMSVADNFFLGREPAAWGGWIARYRQRREALELCQSVGLDIDIDQPVESFPIALRYRIEIAKALSQNPRIMIMDEPTGALTAPEVAKLFELITDLKKRGCAIVYISHKMEEIYQIADRITVLRDGARVGTRMAKDLPQTELVQWMIGRSVAQATSDSEGSKPEELGSPVGCRGQEAREKGAAPALRVENLSVPGQVRDLSFAVRAGEVLGLAGLQGSGSTPLLQAVFGAIPSSGHVWLGENQFERRTPRRSLERGLAYLSPDRKGSGLVLGLSIRENVSLASLPAMSRWGWMSGRAERVNARAQILRFGVKCESLDQEVGTLSGGNQQKVALAKCLATLPKVLLLDEPTRGVDVGAKHEIYELVRRWKKEGMAIVLISTEMPELLSLSDRILVLHRGKAAAELDRAQASAAKILAAAMGEGVAS